MKKITVSLTFLLALILSCCSSVTRLSFACNEPSADIYINGEYAGRELVTYVFPSGIKQVEVVCNDDGREVYRRTFYVDGHKNNELIDITVRKNYQYSN